MVFPAWFVVLERSGHFPFADDPLAIEDAVLAFLRERVFD